jgi:hypothetical protein
MRTNAVSSTVERCSNVREAPLVLRFGLIRQLPVAVHHQLDQLPRPAAPATISPRLADLLHYTRPALKLRPG